MKFSLLIFFFISSGKKSLSNFFSFSSFSRFHFSTLKHSLFFFLAFAHTLFIFSFISLSFYSSFSFCWCVPIFHSRLFCLAPPSLISLLCFSFLSLQIIALPLFFHFTSIFFQPANNTFSPSVSWIVSFFRSLVHVHLFSF